MIPRPILAPAPPSRYRLFVNDERTLLVRVWTRDDGSEKVEASIRDDPSCIWEPPMTLGEEQVA